MDSHKEAQPKGNFECQLCGLTAPFSYYGQKPPNTHSVVGPLTEPQTGSGLNGAGGQDPGWQGAGRWNPRAAASLLEESYVMKDPFIPDKDKFLILGSQCSLCNRRVCVGTECSLFYSKRFCLPCVNENLQEFPLEIRHDLNKRKSHSKS
ncbi:cysteine-rich DPF motif domain-containing protein 1 isoform X1 [Dermochelys coriacea]|uniref:cysteine-rich DPF motif domain-containing protein 1 isoform X1 n=1 Tax=Dermochelys coriacea TaxID=27794 RepID=UPI0018E6E872|nr:cysteine-rich DPF motif domain-containing protein 1 isoform X1 [Dermochelys coriacea]